MKRNIVILTLLLALLLSACQAAAPTETNAPNDTPTSVEAGGTETGGEAAPTQTAAPGQPEPTSLASGEPMPGCRVTGARLKPNPTLEALFPAVSEQDWIKGPSDATVTILEFSDFQ